jgi:predicted phage terminase large subunit-like protein
MLMERITPQVAAQELLRRRRARANLIDYARFIDVPGAPVNEEDDEGDAADALFKPVETQLAEHHEIILQATQRCIERHRGRTMLFLPPGSAKSTYATVVAPTWAMGRKAGFKVIGVSYGSDLARKFGRRMRSIVKQPKFRLLFDTGLSAESAAANEWALENGSEYMGGGILSGITGNRADCLVSGTLVETDVGPVPIDDLKDCPTSFKVLSLNHQENRLEFCDVEAFAAREGVGIYRVTTAAGRVVEATGDHRIFTAEGYKQARSLTPGDRLVCLVQEAGDGSASGDRWEVEFDHVVSVERIGESAPVFDIQVSKNHNFFANGVLVHNCVLIDDPIKGRQEADSEVIRKSTLEAYQDDVLTRLKPGGSVMITQTRWHEADLAGSILPEGWNGESGMIECRDGETWEVICIPAKATRPDDPLGRLPGEYIWPEWFGEDHWKPFERLPRTWSALYQQVPSPDSGDYFKREWIVPVDHIPPKEEMMIYGGSDYAVTADGGDYTCHAVVGVDSIGRMYLLDLWRQQASSDVWVDALCALVRKWKPVGWAEETGQIKSGVGPFLVKRMLESQAFVYREQFPTRGDKAVRAQSIRGRMAMQGLHVPADAPWLSDFISELMSFPVGVHDDQVDALGLVGQLMDRMEMGSKGEAPKRVPKVVTGGVVAPPLPGRRR